MNQTDGVKENGQCQDTLRERLLREWGLISCKGVSSTLTTLLEEGVGNGKALTDSEGRRVRQLIAHVNVMCQDQTDLCHVSRMLSKHMSEAEFLYYPIDILKFEIHPFLAIL